MVDSIMLCMNSTPISQQKVWDLRDVSWSMAINSGATDGVYLKTIKQIDYTEYYMKLSNYDSYRGIFGHESVNELIASRLGKLLGFNVPEGYLKKALVKIDSVDYTAYVFAAKSYKTIFSRNSFEEYYRSCRISEKESPLDFCKRQNWAEEIYMMFVFDYLIINRDRHGANIEVIKNNGKVLSPLFDNGLSFVCMHTDTVGVDDFDVMLDRPVNNFIGERSLERNLSYIDILLPFNELNDAHKPIIFNGLEGVLDEIYYKKIWEILIRRWDSVKKFRII